MLSRWMPRVGRQSLAAEGRPYLKQCPSFSHDATFALAQPATDNNGSCYSIRQVDRVVPGSGACQAAYGAFFPSKY